MADVVLRSESGSPSDIILRAELVPFFVQEDVGLVLVRRTRVFLDELGANPNLFAAEADASPFAQAEYVLASRSRSRASLDIYYNASLFGEESALLAAREILTASRRQKPSSFDSPYNASLFGEESALLAAREILTASRRQKPSSFDSPYNTPLFTIAELDWQALLVQKESIRPVRPNKRALFDFSNSFAAQSAYLEGTQNVGAAASSKFQSYALLGPPSYSTASSKFSAYALLGPPSDAVSAAKFLLYAVLDTQPFRPEQNSSLQIRRRRLRMDENWVNPNLFPPVSGGDDHVIIMLLW